MSNCTVSVTVGSSSSSSSGNSNGSGSGSGSGRGGGSGSGSGGSMSNLFTQMQISDESESVVTLRLRQVGSDSCSHELTVRGAAVQRWVWALQTAANEAPPGSPVRKQTKMSIADCWAV